MKDLLNKAHVYSAIRALDPSVKISKTWLAALDNHMRRVIAANVQANKVTGRVILKSFVAAAAKQAAGEEASAAVAESTGEPKHKMIAMGAKMRRIGLIYKTSIADKRGSRHTVSGTLTVHTSLKDKPLDAMLRQLVRRRLNEAGIDDFDDIKIIDTIKEDIK